ncbi:MAG: type ISP restriction/modification enzyme, partial [Polyangiaceae bacterium]
EPHDALNDNETYRVVWQVLQALRSHDDRFDAMINKLDLAGRDPRRMEIVAVTDKLPRRQSGPGDRMAAARKTAKSGHAIGSANSEPPPSTQRELEFEIGEIERAIYAKLVTKVGNRHYWEDWAKDIAKIANRHIDGIKAVLEVGANTKERDAFKTFAEELRDDLNDSITDDDIVEMLAQHLVTRPVFEALFSGHSFVRENSMSRAMQQVLDVLDTHRLDKERSTLDAFYESVKQHAEGITTPEAQQRVVVQLYDKFFRHAFPKMSERLGIVYTPVEIVDFILNSVDHLLRTEFGQTLGSPGVHILDPFTGTGTFITRLLQSGLISKEELAMKYAKEIHANEIVLLAYYIAAINIEATYQGIVGGEYKAFEGICLTDTFQLHEKDDLISRVLVDNSARRTRQKKLDIKVIIGNPPYSIGQTSQNDNNQNIDYPHLDERIAQTYAARSCATLSRGLYDSYVRAIRWASDRVGQSGVVGFVTNAGFIESNAHDGVRQCLADEFSSLYVFHLRGNQRTAGELSRREGGKVFGSGSRAPVAISLLVKNPNATTPGAIHFRDIGDYLTREEKLETIASLSSVTSITKMNGWTRIAPDAHGDWVKHRDAGFARYIATATKQSGEGSLRVFEYYSLGVVTNRDAWAFNPSKPGLADNMARMIAFYNAEATRFEQSFGNLDRRTRTERVDGFVDADPNRIAWSRSLKSDVARGTRLNFDPTRIVQALYRPFTKSWLYLDRNLNERVSQTSRFFPNAATSNRVIGVYAAGNGSTFAALMANVVASKNVGETILAHFPLFTFSAVNENAPDDSAPNLPGLERTIRPPDRCDGITDSALTHFQTAYLGEAITKEDVFYYVYGILHSTDYRERYADNLGKELPRIPRVKTVADFWAFTKAGRSLGELHVGYERVPEYGAKVEGPAKPTAAQYRVEKMRFGKGKDKGVIHYNDFFTVRDVPLAAYEYVVNGKSAIEWVMERQSVTTDKASGIVKDANAWATETVGDPRYPLSLLLRVITVSLETMKIVRALPKLDILEGTIAYPAASEPEYMAAADRSRPGP